MYIAVGDENVIRGYDLETQGDPTRGSLFLVAGSSFAQVSYLFMKTRGILTLGLSTRFSIDLSQ